MLDKSTGTSIRTHQRDQAVEKSPGDWDPAYNEVHEEEEAKEESKLAPEDEDCKGSWKRTGFKTTLGAGVKLYTDLQLSLEQVKLST